MGDLLTFKFIMIGDTGVGKSCIVTRFTDNTFEALHNATVGVTFRNVMMNVDSTNIKLQIWDTAGQEIYRSITRSYYRDSTCAMIVYDVTKPETFESVTSWINDVKGLTPDDCQIVIVGNKIDLDRVVPTEDLRVFAEKQGYAYFETSALTGEGIRIMFEECALVAYTDARSKARNKPMEVIPPSSEKVSDETRRRCC